jgi:hypothetical protein
MEQETNSEEASIKDFGTWLDENPESELEPKSNGPMKEILDAYKSLDRPAKEAIAFAALGGVLIWLVIRGLRK